LKNRILSFLNHNGKKLFVVDYLLVLRKSVKNDHFFFQKPFFFKNDHFWKAKSVSGPKHVFPRECSHFHKKHEKSCDWPVTAKMCINTQDFEK
jgi:hypothetical protein